MIKEKTHYQFLKSVYVDCQIDIFVETRGFKAYGTIGETHRSVLVEKVFGLCPSLILHF